MDNGSTIIVFSAIAIFAVALMGVFSFAIARSRKNAARDASGTAIPNGAVQGGEVDGVSWFVTYRPASKNSPPSSRLEARLSFPAPFSVARESDGDRMGKKIGLSSEAQTGDSAFDDYFYIDCLYPDYAASVLGDPRDREAIASFFAARPGLTRLSFDASAKADISHAGPGSVGEADATSFVALASRLAHAASSVTVQRSKAREAMDAIVLIGAAIIGIGGFTAFLVGMISYPPIQGSIYAYGALLGLVYEALIVFGTWRLLKGRSSAFTVFIIALFLALSGGITGGMATLLIGNGALDKAAPKRVEAVVTALSYSSGDDSTTYYAEYRERSSGREDSLAIDEELWDTLAEGQQLFLSVKKGAFGFPWLAGFTFSSTRREE